MRTTTMPDTAVAEAVGYRSESAFSRAYRPSIATGPTFRCCYSLWNGGSVELIWVKFTVRATPQRARRLSCAHRPAEERAEPRDSAQNIDRDPPRLVPREQLAWQPMIPRRSCLLVDPENGKALGSDE
jgi:hypothetical protein